MMSVEEQVKDFLEVWEKRKSGELPSPDLSVSCSVCDAVIMGDEYPDFVNGEIVCQVCRNRGYKLSKSNLQRPGGGYFSK